MEHTDFYMMYKAIRDKEVVALKNALQKFPNHQYDWDENDEPRPRIVRVRNIVIIQAIMRCVGFQKILAMIVAFLLKIWKVEKLLKQAMLFLNLAQ